MTHLAGETRGAPARGLRNRTVLAGLLVVVVATVVRTWLLQRTWFYLDDLVLTNAAAGEPLHGLLSESYYGHLMPGGWLLARLVVEAGPFQYSVAIAQLTVLFALCGLALLRLLVVLFGTRPAILVPLVYFLFSPLLIPATQWWAAGINHLPALAATCLALTSTVQYLRDKQTVHLVATLGWLTAGLAFAELTLFAYVPIAVITLGYFASGSLSQRIGSIWAGYRGAAVALSVLLAGYLALYFNYGWEIVPSPQPADWSGIITNATLTTIPVAAIGGPGEWHVAWAAQLEADPAALVRLAGYVVLITVFALSAITRERGLRAWLIPAGQLAVAVLLVGRSRALFGASIAFDLRFFLPLSLGMALGLALAFLPVLRAVESSEVRSPSRLVDSRAVVGAALAAFVAFSLASAASFPLRHLEERSPEPYLTAVRATVADRSEPATLVNVTVPEWVLGPPVNSYRQALVQVQADTRYPRVVQDDFYVFSVDGELVRPELAVARSARKPAPERCGYPVPGAAAISLDGPVFGFGWRLRIEYEAESDTPARVRIGDVATDVELLEGEHVLEMPGDGSYGVVTITGVDPVSDVCVSGVTVGTTVIPD